MKLLQEALQVYREWLEGRHGTDREALLSRFSSLREYLEPLLEEEEEPGDAEAAHLGDFEVLGELGRGGMGVVYEARQISLDRKVALKVLSMGPASSQAGLVRFKREARIAAGLDHPGLVKILAFGNEGDTYFLAMELVEGAPLDKILEEVSSRGRPGPSGGELGRIVARIAGLEYRDSPAWRGGYVECVLRLLRQVAEALGHAHAAGVVHRDVKPSNILVRPDGRAVLTDFGLARKGGDPTMTMAGDFLGTPYYVSPEQAKGGSVDGRSDVFSLGAVLYEVLTFRKPFQGKSTHQVLGMILSRDPPDPHRIDPALHPDLSAIVLKALEKDPAGRYASAKDLAADIEAFLEYRPVSARRPSPARKAAKWARREPWKASFAAVLLLGIPVLSYMGLYLHRKHGEIARAEALARKDRAEDLLGRAFLLRQEDPGRASRLAARALDLDPGNREARALAKFFDVEGKKKGSPFPPGGATSMDLFLHAVELGNRAFLSRDRKAYEKAIDELRRAVFLSPRPRALYFYTMAMLSFRAQVRKEGVPPFAQAARDAVRGLALFWPERRTSRFFQAVGLASYAPEEALVLLDRLEKEGYPKDHEFFVVKARCLFNAGEKKEALALFEEDLALNGSNPGVATAAYNHMGYLLSSMGDKDGAARYYRKAVDLSPSFAQGWSNLGFVLWEKGNMGEARKCLLRSLKEDQGYIPPILTLVDILRRERNFTGAVALLRKGLERAPENYSIVRNLAWFLRKMGKAKEAEEEYRRLAGLYPDRGGGYNGLGLLHGRDPVVALYWFRRAVEAEPGDPKYRLNLGTALARLGRFEEALPQIREAVTRSPGHKVGHMNLVRVYKDLKRPLDARKEILRWLGRRPSSAWDWFTLAELHAAGLLEGQGRGLEEWTRAAERAVALTGRRDPEALLFLARARKAGGDGIEAWKLLEEARRLLGRPGLSPSKKKRVEAGLRKLERAWKKEKEDGGGGHGPGSGRKVGPGGRVQQGAGVRRGQGPGR